jgi:hypothetical protein
LANRTSAAGGAVMSAVWLANLVVAALLLGYALVPPQQGGK